MQSTSTESRSNETIKETGKIINTKATEGLLKEMDSTSVPEYSNSSFATDKIESVTHDNGHDEKLDLLDILLIGTGSLIGLISLGILALHIAQWRRKRAEKMF
ncbi:unnamed protein product, partial [Hymenolepis diminuta]